MNEINIDVKSVVPKLRLNNSNLSIKDGCAVLENKEEVMIIPLNNINFISYKK